jgi:hypothetical protein
MKTTNQDTLKLLNYGGENFRFTKMPFGLSLAPFWQQMMSLPIAAMFRRFGMDLCLDTRR